MPLTFIAAPKCTTCTQSVYHAEMQLGPSNKVYHKGCMKCMSCQKALRDATSLVDHDGDPYCKPCHQRSFGPKGYGNGGALVGSYVERFSPSPSPSPRALPALPILSTPTSATRNWAERQNESPLSPSERGTMGQSPGQKASTMAQSPLSGTRTSITGSGGAGRFTSPVKDVCPACKEVVYFAEAILAAGSKWHKRCLKCTKCGTSLSASQLSDRDGAPYCTHCYKVEFGKLSNGLMSRPGFA